MKRREPGFMQPGEEVQDDDEPTTAVVANPSTVRPMETVRTNQCTAHRKNGERCRKASIKGATVCRSHGGAAPQVRRAAQIRLAMAADDLIKMLLKIALSSDDEGMRYRATVSALDRAGVGPKAELEVSHELKPFEQILEGLVFSDLDRSSIATVAPADDPALDRYSRAEAGDGSIIDAEVVEDEPDRAPTPVPPPQPGMETFDWDDPRAYGGPPRRRRGTRMSRVSRGG